MRKQSPMYSAEVLSQLRSLNWLTQEIRRVPPGSRECALLQNQMDAVRSRLPDSILNYHDGLAAGGKATAAEVAGVTCGGCKTKLPDDLLATLAHPGRFGVCPKCGVFLWAATTQNDPAKMTSKGPTTHPHHR